MVACGSATCYPGLLSWDLNDKKILWFESLNKYLIATPPADEIIRRIYCGDSKEQMSTWARRMDENRHSDILASLDGYLKYVNEHLITKQNSNPAELQPPLSTLESIPIHSIRWYSIYGSRFKCCYSSDILDSMLHPKFAHLETDPSAEEACTIKILEFNNSHFLIVNGQLAGGWPDTDTHLLLGKMSMEILQKIYDLPEDKWMGVFHAASVADDRHCLIFAGLSGAGKSTLSALLLANGLDVLADDFLPVQSEPTLVSRMPAAISVKKQGFDLLLPLFPQLEHAPEFADSRMNKTFRYLPLHEKEPGGFPCKALVFISYEKGSGFSMKPLSHEEAFTRLIPDAWISPVASNADRFVRWFLSLPCYNLIYSDNEKMIRAVRHLLKNDS